MRAANALQDEATLVDSAAQELEKKDFRFPVLVLPVVIL